MADGEESELATYVRVSCSPLSLSFPSAQHGIGELCFISGYCGVGMYSRSFAML